jgi:hypothetical protein
MGKGGDEITRMREDTGLVGKRDREKWMEKVGMHAVRRDACICIGKRAFR